MNEFYFVYDLIQKIGFFVGRLIPWFNFLVKNLTILFLGFVLGELVKNFVFKFFYDSFKQFEDLAFIVSNLFKVIVYFFTFSILLNNLFGFNLLLFLAYFVILFFVFRFFFLITNFFINLFYRLFYSNVLKKRINGFKKRKLIFLLGDEIVIKKGFLGIKVYKKNNKKVIYFFSYSSLIKDFS